MLRWILALALCGPVAALACGADSDCGVGAGSYRIHLPAGGPAAQGAIVFAHGYRGSAAGTMRNRGLRRLADDLGVALIALDASEEDWTIPNAPSHGRRPARDEVAYVARVVADAAERFGLDRERMLLSGFSAGGMLTWTVLCEGRGLFAGYAPMSGTFWAPVPDSCPAPPADVIHYHGTEDRVVPMAGRPIGPARQGDLAQVLAMYRADGGYLPAAAADAPGDATCEAWANPDGRRLELCTFPGGHGFRLEFLRRAWALLVPHRA